MHCLELEWNWELGIFFKKELNVILKNWNWKVFIALSITCAIPFQLNCLHPCQGSEQINWNWEGIAILKNCKGIALFFLGIAIADIVNWELGIGLCMAIKL